MLRDGSRGTDRKRQYVAPAGLLGLGAALGAGVVVGLAVASPASADESAAADSGPRAAATADRSSRASSGAAHPGDRRRGAPAPARSGGAEPTAVVSATRVVRSAAATRVPAPTVTAARGGDRLPVDGAVITAAVAAVPEVRRSEVVSRPAAARPAAVAAPAATAPSVSRSAVPAAASSSSSSARGSLCSCDPRGRLITVYKGLHFVLPQSPAFFIKQVTGTGTFTADSGYDLGDADQYDWNKFTGIVYSPLRHDKNSAMVGWRYNLVTEEFEIAPFYNVNKERILPNEQTEVISVPADGTFRYTVDYSGVTISYGDETVFKPYPPGLTPNFWTSTRVSGWFGGNEAAPRTLTYYLALT